MSLIANSLIEHDGKTYRPGAALPEDDIPAALRWLGSGLAIGDEPQPEQPEASEAFTGHLDPEELATWTKPQLEKLATDMGLETKSLKTKADLVAAIASVEVEAPASAAEGGEDEPDV